MDGRPRLLDLFAGAGGAARGYQRAGFYVVGVDIVDQPRYAGDMFVRADALKVFDPDFWILGGIDSFDAIHASPPCQAYSSITAVRGKPAEHPRLIAPTRDLLLATGLPYVIENVDRAKAHLRDPIRICGVAMGLAIPEGILRRHRWFETNWPLMSPGCGCHRGDGKTLGVYGGGTSQKSRRPPEGWDTKTGGRPDKANREQARRLMEMPWATRAEMNQAIPPAYAELIGHQLMQHLRARERALLAENGRA